MMPAPGLPANGVDSGSGDRWRPSRIMFDAWERLRGRGLGLGLRRMRGWLDPVEYATWYAWMWLKTFRPRTFNQKIQYKMVRDRRPILKTYSDKIAVRELVARTVGPEVLTTLYQVHETAGAIDWDALPREFVVKVSHASGGGIIVTERTDPRGGLPGFMPRGHGRYVVHPDALDRERAVALLDRWLERTYGWSGWKREWGYQGIPRRVFVEEFLRGPDGTVPTDFKVYVFNGRAGFVEVVMSRFDCYVIDVYTADWEYLPVDYERPRSNAPQPPPPRLGEMLRISEQLAADTDFVRVDLYALEDRIAFGELTNYPSIGRNSFDPPHYDRIIGDWWTVPARYR
jgi:hypothetical protein